MSCICRWERDVRYWRRLGKRLKTTHLTLYSMARLPSLSSNRLKKTFQVTFVTHSYTVVPCIHFIQYHKFTKCNRNVSSVSWTKILHVFASCLWNQMHLPLITRITALTYLSGIIYYLWLPVENLKNCRLSVAFCKTTTAKKGLQWKHIFNPKTNA